MSIEWYNRTPARSRDLADHSDSLLASGLRSHSEDALAEVYRRHGHAVAGFARQRTGSAGSAEDIAQEVFLSLWREPSRFEPSRGSLRTYLLMMTSRRAIDIYRSEQARGRRQDRFSAGTDPSALATADPEDSLVASEDAALVRGALDALPLEERAAIDLAYFGHHSYREVAQLLGKPEGTIKSRIRTGLGRLRSTPDLQRAFAS